MSWSDFLTAALGGLIGGSISAFITWLWTHRKWERTARAFKTTSRYLARLILAPETVGDLREDEKGWLRGFDQIIHVGETEEIHENVVAVLRREDNASEEEDPE